MGAADRHSTHTLHGNTPDTLTEALDAIGMDTDRTQGTIDLVYDILNANQARWFAWYVETNQREICCYWNGSTTDQMWITVDDLRIHTTSQQPQRPANFTRRAGTITGWILNDRTTTPTRRQQPL